MNRAVPQYFPSRSEGGKGYDAITPSNIKGPSAAADIDTYTDTDTDIIGYKRTDDVVNRRNQYSYHEENEYIIGNDREYHHYNKHSNNKNGNTQQKSIRPNNSESDGKRKLFQKNEYYKRDAFQNNHGHETGTRTRPGYTTHHLHHDNRDHHRRHEYDADRMHRSNHIVPPNNPRIRDRNNRDQYCNGNGNMVDHQWNQQQRQHQIVFNKTRSHDVQNQYFNQHLHQHSHHHPYHQQQQQFNNPPPRAQHDDRSSRNLYRSGSNVTQEHNNYQQHHQQQHHQHQQQHHQHYDQKNSLTNNLLMFRDSIPELDDDDARSAHTNWSQRHLLRNQRETNASVVLAANSKQGFRRIDPNHQPQTKEQRPQPQQQKEKPALYSPIAILKIKNKSRKKSYLKSKSKSSFQPMKKMIMGKNSAAPPSSFSSSQLKFERNSGLSSYNPNSGPIGTILTATSSKKRLDQYHYQDLAKENFDFDNAHNTFHHVTSSSDDDIPSRSHGNYVIGKEESSHHQPPRKNLQKQNMRNPKAFVHNSATVATDSNMLGYDVFHQKKTRQYKVWNEDSMTMDHPIDSVQLFEKKKQSSKKSKAANNDFQYTNSESFRNHERRHNLLKESHGEKSPVPTATVAQSKSASLGMTTAKVTYKNMSKSPKGPTAAATTAKMTHKQMPKTQKGPITDLISPIHAYNFSHDEMSPKSVRLGIRPKYFDDDNAQRGNDRIPAVTSWDNKEKANTGNIPLSIQHDEHNNDANERGDQHFAHQDEPQSNRNIGQGYRYNSDQTERNNNNKVRLSIRKLTLGGEKMIERVHQRTQDESRTKSVKGKEDYERAIPQKRTNSKGVFHHQRKDERIREIDVEKENLSYRSKQNSMRKPNLTVVTDPSKIDQHAAKNKKRKPKQEKAENESSVRDDNNNDSFDMRDKIVNESWAPSPIKVEGSFARYNPEENRNKDTQNRSEQKDEEDSFMRTVAAIVIQTFFRRHLAYRLTLERYSAVITIQRFFTSIINGRIDAGKQKEDKSIFLIYDLAASQIQAVWRGWWVRDCLNVDNYCASVIQRNTRAFLIKCRRKKAAAILIQKQWRGFSIKKKRQPQIKERRISLTKTKRTISHSEKTLRTGTATRDVSSRYASNGPSHSTTTGPAHPTTGPARPPPIKRNNSKTSQTSSQRISAEYNDEILRKWRQMRERNKQEHELAEF